MRHNLKPFSTITLYITTHYIQVRGCTYRRREPRTSQAKICTSLVIKLHDFALVHSQQKTSQNSSNHETDR